MNDLNTATVRTALPAGWALLIVALLDMAFGWHITLDQLAPWAPVIAFGFGVLYRLGREIERKWPAFGRVIFGTVKQPTY